MNSIIITIIIIEADLTETVKNKSMILHSVLMSSFITIYYYIEAEIEDLIKTLMSKGILLIIMIMIILIDLYSNNLLYGNMHNKTDYCNL